MKGSFSRVKDVKIKHAKAKHNAKAMTKGNKE
jgi:hypothetical protein